MPPQETIDGVLHPGDLAQIERLELLSARVVDGLLAGRHRSKLKGGSAEFAEHRAYTARRRDTAH